MKLTVNTLRVLRAAVAHRAGTVVTTTGGGRGPLGGRVNFGGRDGAAAQKLRDAGLLEFVKHEQVALTNGGYTVHVTDTYWVVTSAGRVALEVYDRTAT